MSEDAEIKRKDEPWFRELREGLIECMVRDGDIRLRVKGTPEQVSEAVELFEEWTGKKVTGEWKRPIARKRKVIPGQTSLINEHESEDKV